MNPAPFVSAWRGNKLPEFRLSSAVHGITTHCCTLGKRLKLSDLCYSVDVCPSSRYRFEEC